MSTGAHAAELVAADAYAIAHLEGEEAFSSLRADWESLWLASDDVSDAQSWAWQYNYWRYLAPRATPVVVVARDSSGRCRALCAVARTRDRGSLLSKLAFLGDEAPDYHHIVAAPEVPVSVGVAMIEYAAGALGSGAFMQLGNVPERSYTGAVLGTLIARERARDASWTTETFSVPLPPNLEEYLQQLGKRSRRDFGYDRRRLQKEHRVSFDVYSTPDELSVALDAVEAVDRSRWGADSRYTSPAYRSFIGALADALVRHGMFRAYVLSVDDKPVSYVTGTVLRGELRLRAIAHDPSFPRRFSVGKVTNFYAIEHCIREGLTAYDLSRGAEAYKQWLGAVPSTNLHYRRFRSKPDQRLYRASAAGLRRLRSQDSLRRLYQRARGRR